MASTKRPPSDPPGSRRRRPPTVINLEATEVPPNSQAAPATDDPAPQQQAADAPVSQQAKPGDTPVDKPAEMPPEQVAFEPPPPPEPAAQSKPAEPPPSEPWFRPESTPQADERPHVQPPPNSPPPASPPRQPWPPMVAGLSGAAGGLMLFLLLWVFGAFSSNPPASVPVQASSPDLSPRLAAIEQQLKDIAARPAPAAPAPADTKALSEMAARLARLEGAAGAPRAPTTDPALPALQSRVTAAENATKSMADNVAAMARRMDSLEAVLRDTTGQIEKLSATATELQTRMRETGPGSDRASRLAVAATALRASVERGDPYAAELAVVKPLSSDSAAVALLEPFAAKGLPKEAALGQELAAIVRSIQNTQAEAPRVGGFLEKLQANAGKLIHSRPIGEAVGDDRSAILARIEQRAAQANLAGAQAELTKLPADAREPIRAELQAWIAKADARNKALDASRRIAADAVAALKASP